MEVSSSKWAKNSVKGVLLLLLLMSKELSVEHASHLLETWVFILVWILTYLGDQQKGANEICEHGVLSTWASCRLKDPELGNWLRATVDYVSTVFGS